MLDRDEEPVLNGEIYCSPSCDCGCTRAAYERAVSEAESLAKRMGSGWKANVWENGGWYYDVRNGVAAVVPSISNGCIRAAWHVRGYTASISISKIQLQFCASANEPEDAYGFAVQDARTGVSLINAELSALLEGFGEQATKEMWKRAEEATAGRVPRFGFRKT